MSEGVKPVFWEQGEVRWSGASYAIVLPICLDHGPSLWLDKHPEEITAHMGGVLRIDAATPSQSGGGYASVGSIAIAELQPPLPDASEVHAAVTRAVARAYSETEVADALAKDYLIGLRAPPTE